MELEGGLNKWSKALDMQSGDSELKPSSLTSRWTCNTEDPGSTVRIRY